jgi:tetratricopeptide (TPR) repeat protein
LEKIILPSIIGVILFFGLFSPLYAVETESIDTERAEKLIKLGNFLGLLSYTQELLQDNPNDLNVLFYRGVAFWGAGSYENSINFLDQTLELDPENTQALYYKSKSLFDLERYDEALLVIEEALEIDPNYEEAKLHKETMLNKKDSTQEFESESEAYWLIRKATGLAQVGDYQGALRFVDQALELEPENVNALNDKGWILIQKGDLREALVWIDNAYEIDPTNPHVLFNKGWILFQLGDNDESILWFEKLIELSPNHELVSYIPNFGLKFRTYENPAIGLTFEYPSDWIEKKAQDEAIKPLYVSPDNTAMISVFFDYLSVDDVSLDMIQEFELNELQKTSKNFVLEESSLISIGNDFGRKLVFESDESDVTLKFVQIIVVKNKGEYVVSIASILENFDDHGETIQKIIESLQIENVEPPIMEYANSKDNFKIEYPTNWLLIEGESSNDYMTSLISPFKNIEDTFPEEVNFVVVENEEEQSLDEIVEDLSEFYSNFIRNFNMIESHKTTLNGIDAHKFVYDGKIVNPYLDPNRLPIFGSHPVVDLINIVASEEIDSNIMQIVFLHDDKVYLLTYRASPNDFDSFLPEAEKVIDSFELGRVQPIPDWIKNNAQWWAEGGIGDKDFVTGIQFLIKEGIMQIPETAQSSTKNDSQEIPVWIKNNADWWAQGLISDDDFVKGIQFLVKEGIIKVS